MIHKMKTYSVLSPSITQNSFNQEVESLMAVGSVSMFISLVSGSAKIANNVKTAQSTHIGLSTNKELLEGRYIQDGDNLYKIDYVDNVPRLSVAYLSMEKAYGK